MCSVPTRTIIIASMIGTLIEWYDAFIFGTGAYYLKEVFYPFVTPLLGLTFTYLTFALTYFTRPVGAFIFGHYGDKLGRKRMLIYTILISGISSGLIGVLPPYAIAGFLSVGLLVLFRLLVGFSLGGEWGGALLLSIESLQKRGLASAFVQSTVGIAMILGSLVFLILPPSQMLAYGWRIPFLLSFIMVVIGVIVRLKVPETPIFEAVKREGKILKLPASVVFKKYWKQVLIGTFMAGALGNFFYYGAIFLPGYFETLKIIPVSYGLVATVIFGVLDSSMVYVSGFVTDIIGRKPLLIASNIIALLMLYPSVLLKIPITFLIFVALFGFSHGLGYTALGDSLSEIFPTEVRYSGSSFSYQFGNSFIGGPTPLISSLLGSINFFLYPVFTLITILIALGFITTVLPETKQIDLAQLKVS